MPGLPTTFGNFSREILLESYRTRLAPLAEAQDTLLKRGAVKDNSIARRNRNRELRAKGINPRAHNTSVARRRRARGTPPAIAPVVGDRISDDDGHLWPITGHYCETCRWPLIPIDGATTHPTCETENTK